MILNFIFTSLATSYTFINGDNNDWNKPIYLSRSLSEPHTSCVVESIKILNEFSIYYEPTSITDTYVDGESVRIGYYEPYDQWKRRTASSSFHGILLSSNQWQVEKTSINLNQNITDFDTCCSIVLHELLHVRGLYHTDYAGSVLNSTVYFSPDGYMYPLERPRMTLDDIIGLMSVPYK